MKNTHRCWHLSEQQTNSMLNQQQAGKEPFSPRPPGELDTSNRNHQLKATNDLSPSKGKKNTDKIFTMCHDASCMNRRIEENRHLNDGVTSNWFGGVSGVARGKEKFDVKRYTVGWIGVGRSGDVWLSDGRAAGKGIVFENPFEHIAVGEINSVHLLPNHLTSVNSSPWIHPKIRQFAWYSRLNSIAC